LKEEDMAAYDRNSGPERRKEPRHSYSGTIFFATRERLYEGELINHSLSGLFIKTEDFLSEGERVTVALPYSDEQNEKHMAIIIWCDGKGIGVKFKD
jgi:hypothetical protein